MFTQHVRRKVYTSTAIVAALVAASPAQAAIFIYFGVFSGANENPANASPATGSTIVTVDTTLNTIRVQANFSGLGSNTNNAHIHCCAALPTNNAPVALGLSSFPLGVTSGSYDFTHSVVPSAAFFTGLNNGQAYVNIHTVGFPGGEIRANLAAVPEPATWLSMMFGFGLLGVALRRPAVRTRVKYS